MKIAIFQNFLDNIGGAEVVGLTMARELSADIYTTNIDKEKISNMGFADVLPRIYSIGKVPVNAPFRQQAVLTRFRLLNLTGKYDFFIINGDWAVSGAVNNKPNLWYVNATIREIWDLREYVRKHNVSFLRRPIFDAWSAFNRRLNIKHISHVGTIATNSMFTRDRVKKYLNRESEIVYPPTQTKKFTYKENKEYWLSVNRLIGYKRVDMQMRAFAKMPEQRLVVLGPYEKSAHCKSYADHIKGMAPSNVTLLSQADDFTALMDYYGKCKGFITTCLKEDFGMTVVEAMASGKPVIAPNEGGYMETIVNGKTGILIDDIDENKLVEAVHRMDAELKDPRTRELYREACQSRASQFDASVFSQKIKELMKKNSGSK